MIAQFLDDLPDILNHRLFPKNTMGILFGDPKKAAVHTPNILWTELESFCSNKGKVISSRGY